MFAGFLWVLGLALSSTPFVEPMARQEVGGVSFLAPSQWVKVQSKAGGATRFETPEGDAFIEIGVAELNPIQSPSECLKEMVQRVEGEYRGWVSISMDDRPAARWMGTKPGDKEELPSAQEGDSRVLGKEMDTRITEITFMGCNGARQWYLNMSAKTRDAGKYGPTFRRVRESFQYAKHTPPRAPAKGSVKGK